MDSDKIIQELNQRFAAPLPEFYKRRIVFWYDEDGEFQDRLDEVTLNNAKLLALTGTNNFAVKKLLSVDDTTSNYLIYCPLSYEKPEENWLLDIELYSEEFRADLISIWMDELGIPSTPAMRKQVKEYRKYFNAKTRRDKIAGQSKAPTVPAQLHMAVMGALGGLKDVSPAAIMKEVLGWISIRIIFTGSSSIMVQIKRSGAWLSKDPDMMLSRRISRSWRHICF